MRDVDLCVSKLESVLKKNNFLILVFNFFFFKYIYIYIVYKCLCLKLVKIIV